MAVECPVCREPIPWPRVFLTPAWGSWECQRCGSRLGVRVGRRMVLIFFFLTVWLLLARLFSASLSDNLLLVLALLVMIGVPYFALLERARVIDRRGLRCPGCGYDLQGQIQPRCPECGRVFSEDEFAGMKQLASQPPAPRGRRARWAVVIGIVVVAGLVAAQIVGIVALRKAQSKRAAPGPVEETRAMAAALMAYAGDHDGRLPLHASELVPGGYCDADAFVTFSTLTDPAKVPVDGTTLDQFAALPAHEQRAVARRAGEDLPQLALAYRLGDFVFTCRGNQCVDARPTLWIALWSPDPAQNPPIQPDEAIPVVLADGNVTTVTAAEFAAAFAEQNEVRRGHGLPPLSRDPFGATHARPIVGDRYGKKMPPRP